MDGSAVRALAARVDAVARGVGEEARLLQALATTGWSGPAARACERTVGDRAVHADRVRDDLHEVAAALRAHAAAVDRALVDLATAAVGATGGAAGAGAVVGGAARRTLAGAQGVW